MGTRTDSDVLVHSKAEFVDLDWSSQSGGELLRLTPLARLLLSIWEQPPLALSCPVLLVEGGTRSRPLALRQGTWRAQVSCWA